MKKVFFFLTLFLLLINIYCYGQSNINKANQAMTMVEIDVAENLFKKALLDSNENVSDRITAANMLIYLNGKFYNDMGKAKQIAEFALKFKKNESAIFLKIASQYCEKKYFDTALIYIAKSLEAAVSYNDTVDAISLQAKTVFRLLKEAIHDKTNIDQILLDRTIHEIRKYQNNEIVNFDFIYYNIGLSLIHKQGDEVLKAWKQYFLISDTIPIYLNIAWSELSSVLFTWNKGPLKQSEAITIISGLGHSRMYEFAEMMSVFLLQDSYNEKATELADIISYQNFFLCASQNLTYDYYNKVILNKSEQENYFKQYDKELTLIKEKFWNMLIWSHKKKSYSDKNFKSELFERFGLKHIYGTTNSFKSMYGGHVISENIGLVEQYGKKCKFKFYVVDIMHSNDLMGYFLDNFIVGGWANKEEVVQVGHKYITMISNLYKIMDDSTLRNNFADAIDRQLGLDEIVAAKEPICDLPGVCLKMMYDDISFIYDSLKSVEFEGASLKMEFINILNSASMESSIMAHEGRHKLDYKYRPWLKHKSHILEYNAKISEIVFCKYPFLMLSKIMVYNPEAKDPHAQASALITTGLYHWIEVHKDEIKNFDLQKPSLPQIRLLSDLQLKEALKSMDVWGKKFLE